jgi:tetratricopeptide (TPR) repeat protein
LAHDYDEIDDLRMAEVFARRALELDASRTEMRYLLFRVFERQGAHLAAAGELEQVLAREPANWPIYSMVARLYLESGQLERIDRLFARALKRPDAPPEIKVNIAYILARSGRTNKAEAIYRTVLKTRPEDEDAWSGLAELELGRGQREQAVQCYLRAARSAAASPGPMHELAQLLEQPVEVDRLMAAEEPEVLYRLGLAFSEAAKYDLATRVFQHIVSQRPADVAGWLDPARFFVQQGDWEQVDQVLRRATAAMPDSTDLYLFWGTALERAGRIDEAIAVYREGLESQPTNPDLFLYWGFALEQQEKWEEAIAVYRQSLALIPVSSELCLRWGIALFRQDKWAEAVPRCEQAAQLDSLNRDAFIYWGLALQQLDQWPAAIDKLTYAVQVDSESTHALFYLASGLEQAGRKLANETYFDRAVTEFKRLLEMDPNDAYALNYLGYLYAERGIQLEEAVQMLLRAVGLEPDNSAFLDSLGWAYFRLGRLDQAENYLGLALEKLKDSADEDQAVIFGHAGDIARALGKVDEARHHWEKALEYAPDDQVVRRKLGP